MSIAVKTKANAPARVPAIRSTSQGGLLQRKCACGGAPGFTGECEECSRKRLSSPRTPLTMQTKLTVNRPCDEFEQEADRVAEAVVSGRPAVVGARTTQPALQREEKKEKPPEPATLPPQNPPMVSEEKDEKEQLKEGGGKAAGEGAKLLWDQFANSEIGKSTLAASERDLKRIYKFFEDYLGGVGSKVALGAAAGGAVAGAAAAAWSGRKSDVDPDKPPPPGGPVLRSAAEEKSFALELKWDFITAPTGLTLKTPWLDAPTIPLGPKQPAAKTALPPPATVFKEVPRIPRICTPTDPQGDQGEADARSAFIFWWLQDNQEMAEKREQERLNQSQLHAPPKFAPSAVQPMFKVEAGNQVVHDPQAIEAGLRSPGQPLDTATRSFMESGFGHDFGQVRIHTDGAAKTSTRAVDALAFTVGRDIVFGDGLYAPTTPKGQRLLAHELTHVVQQRGGAKPTSTIMRRGRTFGGFADNLIHFWDYSKETLDAYLKTISDSNHIEGDDDSDDKARQVVAEWKKDKSRYSLPPATKVLLVREMLDGIVSTADQEGIMDLLEGSDSSELKAIFQELSVRELQSQFDSLKPRLALFDARVLQNLDQFKAPDPREAKSIENGLSELGAPLGIEFSDLSVSFQIAPGNLFESFKVNVTVPAGGVYVTITLTRAGVKVSLQPGILIDVVWPLANAEFRGFTLSFAGLKPELDIEGNQQVSSFAQEQLEKYLKGLLAGTRFEDPKYNPVKDPSLISELTHEDVIGDINRVRYNFAKDQKKDSESKMGLQDISTLSIYLNLIHKTGFPIPSSGYGIVIPPGSGFSLQIFTSGSAAELKKKDARLEKVRIVSLGIFLYKGNAKIACLKSIEMTRDFKITLGEIQTFVDLRSLAREESKGKLYESITETITSILPEETARDLVVWYAEGEIRSRVRGLLVEHRETIKGALGISDKQLAAFFGEGED